MQNKFRLALCTTWNKYKLNIKGQVVRKNYENSVFLARYYIIRNDCLTLSQSVRVDVWIHGTTGYMYILKRRYRLKQDPDRVFGLVTVDEKETKHRKWSTQLKTTCYYILLQFTKLLLLDTQYVFCCGFYSFAFLHIWRHATFFSFLVLMSTSCCKEL